MAQKQVCVRHKPKTRLDKNDKELVASVNLAERHMEYCHGPCGNMIRGHALARLARALAQFAASNRSIPYSFGVLSFSKSPCKAWTAAGFGQGYCEREFGCEGASADIRFWHLLGFC